jgi:hypothetical protein
MQEHMLAWVRMHGPENFPGELNYFLEQSELAQSTSSTSRTRPMDSSVQNESMDGGPRLQWISMPAWADVSLVQGGQVQRWGRLQRLVLPWQGKNLDWQKPMAVLEPVQADVPKALRVDPRSREQLHTMWREFAAELEPIRLQFTVGLRSFELLSRIQQPLSNPTHYYIEWQHEPLASLQPASGWVHLSPSAQPHGLMQAQWRRRQLHIVPSGHAKHSTARVLGVYCQRTTRRLFSNRLRGALIRLRSQAVVRLADHSDEVLSLLIQLRIGQASFADLAHQLSISYERLGNLLLGLYLSGIVELEVDTAAQSLYNSK